MADQADVETALVAAVATALYPSGSAQQSAVIGPPGPVTCRVYRGAPNSPTLDPDLARGVMHATVFPDSAPVRNVTRYPRVWRTVAPVPATLTVSVSGNTARFGGSCAVGQLAGIAIDGATFPYAVQARDTPATVASNIAAMLRAAGWLVQYSGTTVTVPAARMFAARTVAGAGALEEIRRQVQDFRISLWCPDPATRDAAAGIVDLALAETAFLALADGSSARLIFTGTMTTDRSADAALYRRDLVYSAEYPTTRGRTDPAMLFGIGGIGGGASFIAGVTG